MISEVITIKYNNFGLIIYEGYENDMDTHTGKYMMFNSPFVINNPELVTAIIKRFQLKFHKKGCIKFFGFQSFDYNSIPVYFIPLTSENFITNFTLMSSELYSFNITPRQLIINYKDKPALKIIKTGNSYRLVLSSAVIHQMWYPTEIYFGYTNKGIVLYNCRDSRPGFAVHPLTEQDSYVVYSTQLAKCILRKCINKDLNKGTIIFQTFDYLEGFDLVLIPFNK